MPSTGTVRIALLGSSGQPVQDTIQIHLTPQPGSAGGQVMRTPEFGFNGAPACQVGGVSCAPLGTMYTIQIFTRRHQTDGFFCRVAPENGEQITRRLLVDPDRVTGIAAPAFSALPRRTQSILENSAIDQMQDPDAPGHLLKGEALYNRFSDRQKACLLNVAAKASHPSSRNVWDFVEALRRVEQDRVFALVRPDCLDAVRSSERFEHAPGLLHQPMPHYDLEPSFKTRDAHANLQVTFMRQGNQWAADIDIDEASGFGHAFEVVRNTFGGPTEPYQVRELLLLYPPNPEEFPAPDPGYTFRFGSEERT